MFNDPHDLVRVQVVCEFFVSVRFIVVARSREGMKKTKRRIEKKLILSSGEGAGGRSVTLRVP